MILTGEIMLVIGAALLTVATGLSVYQSIQRKQYPGGHSDRLINSTAVLGFGLCLIGLGYIIYGLSVRGWLWPI